MSSVALAWRLCGVSAILASMTSLLLALPQPIAYNPIMSDDVIMESDEENKLEDSPSSTVPSRVMVPQPHGGAILSPIRTREQALVLSEARWGKYRRAAEQGMVQGVFGERVPLNKAGAVMAYSKIVATQASAASTIDYRGQTNTQAARFVREAIAADIGAPTQRNSATDSGITVTLSISADVAASLAERLAKLLGGGA